MDLVIRIVGAAGQGVQTVGAVLARGAFRKGLTLHAEQSYHSRIRGGENAFAVRLTEEPTGGTREDTDLLVALNQEMLDQYLPTLADGGWVVCEEELEAAGKVVRIPAKRLAKDELKLPIAANMVMLGAAAKVAGIGEEPLAEVVREVFGDRAELNLKALALGAQRAGEPRLKVPPAAYGKGERMLLTGGAAVGAGAVVAGCRYVSSYPMTPGTAVLTYLAERASRWGLVVEQAEDEIAAINMALGAAYAGVRSMLTTAGGGFSLMVEGLSLAGMIETPVVIHIGQRPAPATGLPTRTGQEELLFAIHAGHGEFPRYVVAPRTAEEAFYLTGKAFDLAEKHQVPALILTDQYLVESYNVCNPLDASRVAPRSHLLSAEELAAMENYDRFALTDSGVSPRAAPGVSDKLVLVDSDEHDSYGRITEDLQIRKEMTEKRLRKEKGLLEDVAPPTLYPAGSFEGRTVCLGWGSTYGAIREAVDGLNANGGNYGLIHFSELWPLRTEELIQVFREAERVIAVEANATGQLAQLVAQQTGRQVERCIGRYDGRPLTAEGIAREVEA
ncbi:MAG: 2-oxoacid:acceptor oxidoreductase subunit alpha [Candidatus Bipolaricaulota bacterium]